MRSFRRCAKAMPHTATSTPPATGRARVEATPLRLSGTAAGSKWRAKSTWRNYGTGLQLLHARAEEADGGGHDGRRKSRDAALGAACSRWLA